MADPLSITISVVTLIKVAGHASILLHQFCVDVGGINATLSGLLNDVNGFQKVLEGMRETFLLDDIKANLTGHAGTHWKNLARSLKDGEQTLVQLTELLEGVNKKTKFLDGPRKVARMKAVEAQIGLFREQVQSYRGALELSLSTVILWNQVTFQKSNEQVMGQILPNLDRLFEEFRNLGKSLNAKIEKLQESVDTQNEGEEHQLTSLKNLRDCVRSAADVASTTSSTLTANKVSDGPGSVKFGSDLGDVFTKEPDERMLHWISANVVHEDETITGSSSQAPADDQSDSDSDFEAEMIQALFESANQLKEDDDLTSAERKLRSCLSLSSQQSTRGSKVTKQEILEALLDTYWMMQSWSKAKDILMEKMAITERQFGTKDESYHWDTLKLATLSKKNNEHVEAQLQGRRALRGFRKLKAPGFLGYEKCLLFLIDLCSAQEKYDEQDAYTALLASHQAKQNARSVQPRDASLTPTSKTLDESVRTNESNTEPTAGDPDLGGTTDENEQNIVRNNEQKVISDISNPVEDLSDELAGLQALRPASKRDLLWAKTNIKARGYQGVSGIYSMLYETAEVRRKYSKHLELLAKLGAGAHGRNPTCASYLDEDGSWSCLLLLDEDLGFLAKAPYEEMAWKAVILQTCAFFDPRETRELLHDIEKVHDPVSDKVAIAPALSQSQAFFPNPDLLITISIGSEDTSVYFFHYTTLYHATIAQLKNFAGMEEALSQETREGQNIRPHVHNFPGAICGLMPRQTRLKFQERLESSLDQNSASWQYSLEWSNQYIESLFRCIEHGLHPLLLIPWKNASLHYIFATSFALRAQSDALPENAISQLAHDHQWTVQKLDVEAIVFDSCQYEDQLDIVVACEVGKQGVTLSAWSRQKDCVHGMERVNYDLLTSAPGRCGQVVVDEMFEKEFMGILQNRSIKMSKYDIAQRVKRMCQSAEYLSAVANNQEHVNSRLWTIKDPKTGVHVPIKSTGMKSWLDEQADQLTILVSCFLSRLIEEYPGRQVSHLLVYGESATLHHNFGYLRRHFDPSNPSDPSVRDVPSVKVWYCQLTPDDIARSLLRQRMRQYDTPQRYF